MMMSGTLTTPFTDVAARGGVIRSEYVIIYGGIALIFLISGLQLSPAKLKEHVLNVRLHILVQGISFIVFPVVLFGESPFTSFLPHSSLSERVSPS